MRFRFYSTQTALSPNSNLYLTAKLDWLTVLQYYNTLLSLQHSYIYYMFQIICCKVLRINSTSSVHPWHYKMITRQREKASRTRNAYLAALEIAFLLPLLKFTTRSLASCAPLVLAIPCQALSSHPPVVGGSIGDLVGLQVHGRSSKLQVRSVFCRFYGCDLSVF